MPIYIFECTDCKHHWQMLSFKILDEDMHCPKCGCPANKVISAPAIQFKGAGFYETDYKPKKESNDGAVDIAGD